MILSEAKSGRDVAEAFEDVGHSDEARDLLTSMYIGDFEQGGPVPPLDPEEEIKMLRGRVAFLELSLAGISLGKELVESTEEPRRLDLASLFPDLNLTGKVHKRGTHAVNSSGGFADIWRGDFNGDDTVAVKVLRHSVSSLEAKTQKRVFREIKVWSTLKHPNVLPLLGFSLDLGPFPALVSPWQPNGTAPEYLQQKSQTVVFHVVIGAVSGLEHLHHKGIRHGDFKGNNILISADGDAIVCDFGLSKTAFHTFGMTTSSSVQGTVRWMAPELFEENAMIMQESDVWSCGMTILELFSGKVPYHGFRDFAVPLKIVQKTFRVFHQPW